jgi:hypothetical protein
MPKAFKFARGIEQEQAVEIPVMARRVVLTTVRRKASAF